MRIVARNVEVYALKVITLAVALACTTLIALFALAEFGYDRFHNNPHNIFRVLQHNCLVMDLNAAKYPAEALYYTDIKSYEQGAGQHIAKDQNRLPALSCLPLNRSWFWKTQFPTEVLRT